MEDPFLHGLQDIFAAFDDRHELEKALRDHCALTRFSRRWWDAAALTFAIDFNELVETEERWRPPSRPSGKTAWLGA
jgi:hypothetical protein